MKKILKLVISGAIWSYLFLFITDYFLILLWNFDYLSPTDWKTINSFWQQGGEIKTFKDYLFLLSILALIPLWYSGWKYFYHCDYRKFLLFPIAISNHIIMKKYFQDSKRIVLKNLGTSIKMKDEINNKLETIKPIQRKEADKIRDALKKRLDSKKNRV